VSLADAATVLGRCTVDVAWAGQYRDGQLSTQAVVAKMVARLETHEPER